MAQYTEAQLKEAFTSFDLDDNGFIEPKEIKSLLTSLELGEEVVQRICQMIFEIHDKNKDQKISFEEFKDGVEREGLICL